MRNEEAIRIEAVVVQVLGNGLFQAGLKNGHKVLAHCRSRERDKAAGLKIGDGMRLEMSPFDMSKGRILFL